MTTMQAVNKATSPHKGESRTMGSEPKNSEILVSAAGSPLLTESKERIKAATPKRTATNPTTMIDISSVMDIPAEVYPGKASP
jgi:hypothetical protein